MLLSTLYLALFTICLALNVMRCAVTAAWRGDRSPTGQTRLRPAAFAARAQITDYQNWSWGGAAGRQPYGPTALGAVFVMLDLSRLAHDAPVHDAAVPAEHPLLGQDAAVFAPAAWTLHEDVLLATGLALEPAPATAAEAAAPGLDAHDAKLAWDALHSGGHGAFVHDGWLV